MKKKIIGITVGDPAGIGPEVMSTAVKANSDLADFVVYGPVQALSLFPEACITHAVSSETGFTPGSYSKNGGRASIAALQMACKDLANGSINGLITGPIDKRAFTDTGLDFPGQTEMVAQALGVKEFAMNLSGPVLRISLVTTHLAIRDVPNAITKEKVLTTIELTHNFLKKLPDLPSNTIGVLGLNPHASDHGRYGNEEAEIILPAIEAAQSKGMEVSGPLPADTAFTRAVKGEFQALVAMYHDQGLGPLKLYHFDDAVNITLGLPRPRTSPDHGPAFDIAGKGLANPTSAIQAVRLAISLAR